MMTNGSARAGLQPPEMLDFFEEVHSPTDSSEDSVEVKISPISCRNKRKCAEPRKVPETFSGPLKKRMCLKVKAESEAPFRPWSPKTFVAPAAPAGYFRPPSPVKDEPVALVKKREEAPPRVPVHPPAVLSDVDTERIIQSSADAFPGLVQPRREQRNYKNMTRERRIEANARERTRVHTISAAFDTLRRAIPSYSHNQKLSKLSVLRIACSYIMTLSSIVNGDEGAAADCVDLVTKTIQREGKLRKKKDDND
ncbi:protein atonal homolog 8 [Tribolium madens]|uniref:protein atonal homolog 8 n=1 Tax=Tribolium madens TaxID=41895 RepID=UPI001CF73EEB|nr:protein atonal homolog 8 [Tribolium madens]